MRRGTRVKVVRSHTGRLSHALSAILVVSTLVLGWHGSANAEESAKAIAIKTEGPKADEIREIIVELVPEGIEVLDDVEFTRGLGRMGLPGGRIAFALTNPRQKPILLKVVRKTVAAAGLEGAVIARIRARRGIELLMVYQEAEGEPIIDTSVPLKGDREDWKATIRQTLDPVFEDMAPVEEEPEPDQPPAEKKKKKKKKRKRPEDEDEKDEDEEDDEGADYQPNRVGSELFSLFAGIEFGGRFFSYSESIANSPQTRPYDMFGSPGIHFGGEVYPAATAELPFISDLGLTISYMHALGVSSETADQLYQFDSTYNRLWAGLIYRFRLADRNEYPAIINLSTRFGMMNFTFDPVDPTAEAIDTEVAEVGYLLFRPGVDMRIPAGEIFAMMPSFGILVPVGLEDGPVVDAAGNVTADSVVYERFRGASVLGIDMGFGFAFAIDAGFEIRGGFEYTRFWSSFEPEVTDAYVAGGALDQFVALRLGAAYLY